MDDHDQAVRLCPKGVGARLAREADYAKCQANQVHSFVGGSPTGARLSAASAIPVGATGGYDGREAACLTQPRHQVLLPLRARSRTSRAPTPSAEANADADGDQDSVGVAAGRARTCPKGVGARLAREAEYPKCQANQAHRIADESQCLPLAPTGARLSAASAIPVGATGGYDGREAACLTQPRHQVLLPLRARSRTSRAPTPSAEANADNAAHSLQQVGVYQQHPRSL